MNTIKAISERILRVLNGGDVQRDSQFHELDIEYMVRDTAAKLVKGEWFNERNEGGSDVDARYIVNFDGIEVKEDTNTKHNYCEIPVDSWIRLPHGAGIRSVRPDVFNGTLTERTKFSELKPFIPIPSDFEDIFYSLPAGSLEQQFGWFVRKDRIYFTERNKKTLLESDIDKVSIRIVTTDPAAVGINDPLPLSADLTQQLITEVVTILTQGKPQVVDVVNDDNPNITKAE